MQLSKGGIMRIGGGSRSHLAVGLLVLCTAHLLVASTTDAHGDVDGSRLIRPRVVGEGKGEAGHHVVLEWSADRLAEEHGPLRAVHDREIFRDYQHPETFWSKAWSYVSGLANPFGNAFDPVISWGRKLAGPKEEKRRHEHPHPHGHGPDYESGIRQFLDAHEMHGPVHRFHEGYHGPRHRVREDHRDHHQEMGHSFFERIRDAISKRPDGQRGMGFSAVDSERHSARELDTKTMKVVLKAVEEYSQTEMEAPQEGIACLGTFEEQLRTLIRSVKSALRDQVCADGAASGYNMCKLSESFPKMAALMAFAKARVNPVTIALMRTSAMCISSDLFDGVHQVEILASHIRQDQLEMYLAHPGAIGKHSIWEHGHDKSRSGEILRNHEHQHGDKLDDAKDNHVDQEHRENKLDHGENGHGEHEHDASQFFGVVHRLKHALKKHIHHPELKDAHEHDCFVRGVHHLARGLKAEVAMTCSSASSPELIAACEFAKEHKGLTKTYLAMKIAIERTVTTHCSVIQHLPNNIKHFVSGDHEVEHEMGYPFHQQFHMEEPSFLETDMPHLKRFSRGCARHRAQQAFRRAIELRGDLVDVTHAAHHRDMLGGDSFRPHARPAEEAALLDLLHGALPDVELTVTNFFKNSDRIYIQNEKPTRVPLDSSDPTKGFAELRRSNIHISAVPRKLLLGPAVKGATVDFPMSFKDRPHFRISARPRTIPSELDDVKERVNVDASKSSKIATTEEGQ